jgi:hypothetical protein
MMNLPHFPRRARGLMILGVCLLILGALPVEQPRAAVVPREVDNKLDDFKAGTFQRSSLVATHITTPPSGEQPAVPDQAGAVQLIPIGLLKNWFNSPFLLPKRLSNVGAAAIGNNIFVVGGNAAVGNIVQPTNEVWSVAINPATGAPFETQTAWYDEIDLPATKANDTEPISPAARAFSAVTSVETGPNSGFIYVLGGSVKPGGGLSISSYGVSIGKVVKGHITEWITSDGTPEREGMRIPPDPFWLENGVQGASAVSFETNGKTYIYLLGGSQRFREGSGVTEVGSKNVFYAQVNTSSGLLVKPSSPGTTGWDKLADIPIPSALGVESGLWDGAAVANHFDSDDEGIGGDALYLMGGQLTTDPTYNSKVYRALINSTNGTLTWTSPPAPSPWEGTLPEARIGMAGVEFHGNLYVTGGRPSGAQPQKAVLTSYVEDDLTLPDIGDQGSNFLRNADVLLKARSHHASVVVPATPTDGVLAEAYVYVIGGEGDSSVSDPDPTDDLGSDTLIYGKIGTSEDRKTTGFALTGWFYSKAYDINITGAELQKVNWTTVLTHPMDIKMEYRVSVPTGGACVDAGAFTNSSWVPLDGTLDAYFSQNSANSQAMPPLTKARCFQYRAKLTTTGDRKSTPALLNVSILVYIPGSPDLKFKEMAALRGSGGKTLTGLKIVITNQNDSSPPTQPADIEGGGSFFVDLCVFGPGDSPVKPTLPLSDANTQCSDAYAQISKSTMGKDTTFLITQWCKTGPGPGCTVLDPKSLFTKPGNYTLYAAVDSYGYVKEEPNPGAENNNVSAALPVTIYANPTKPDEPDVGNELQLAIIMR